MTDKSNAFAFLLSSERSGSNLLLRLIDAHPELCAPAPTQLFPVLGPNLQAYGDLNQVDNWHELIADAVSLHAASFGVWQRNPSNRTLREALDKHSLAAILREVYNSERLAHGKHRVLIKVHKAYNYIEFLITEFPTAKYLHLVRDPRDMALSWQRCAGLRGGVMRAARVWQNEQEQFLNLTKKWNIEQQLMVVKYENLLAKPTQVLTQICAFLGVRYSATMLNFYLHEMTRTNAQRIVAWCNLAKPLDQSNFGQYRQALSWPEIQYVEAICDKAMTAFGYVQESNEVVNIAELEQYLSPTESWEKVEYASIPIQERIAHEQLRSAIQRIESRKCSL